MRLFWIVVAVLIAGGVALLAVGRDRTPAPAEQAPVNYAAPVKHTAPPPKAAPPAPIAPSPAPAPPESAALAAPIAPGSFETKIEVVSAPPTPPPASAPAAAAPTSEAPKPPPTPPIASAEPAAGAAGQAKPVEPASSPIPAFGAAPAAALAVERHDDGSSLLDGRFAISGDGSKEKPYAISWALLVSASETYKPKQGRTVLPERIKMLNDKYVRITGYIAFPFMAQQATEMLAMQNQWDGCCIGVPPTPYDAIEVTLRRPTVGDERLMQFGVVEGKLKVEPYLRGEWLISLYSMTDAHMAPEM